MKKIILFIGFFVISLFAISSLVLAANDNISGRGKGIMNAERNMTYGQCVSDGATLKNSCYTSVKGTYSSCKANATDMSACKTGYKKDMAQCKSDFKSLKNECKKIKHNWIESARYAFA